MAHMIAISGAEAPVVCRPPPLTWGLVGVSEGAPHLKQGGLHICEPLGKRGFKVATRLPCKRIRAVMR